MTGYVLPSSQVTVCPLTTVDLVEEREARRAVTEDDRVVVRVNCPLHGYRSSRNSTWRPITGSYLRTTRRSGSFLRLFLVT